MNIFYTDRLQVDTDKNKLQVQSIALMVLYEIMSKLKNGDYDIYVGDTTAQVFEEKFSDLCAGAYMTITVSTPIPYVCDEESFVSQIPETITITYLSEQGTAPDTKVVEAPYTITSEDLPQMRVCGYVFDGWDVEIGEVLVEDTTITATFTEAVPAHDYLKFTSVGNSGISLSEYGTKTIDIQYSWNGVEWEDWDKSNINMSDGDFYYFKGTNQNTAINVGNCVKFSGIGNIKQTGSLLSLINETGEGASPSGDYAFAQLFNGMVGLTSADVGSYVDINQSMMYSYLFDGDSNLSEIKATFVHPWSLSITFVCRHWVRGVAANGTFKKSSSMNAFSTGEDGIPSGWTVVNV